MRPFELPSINRAPMVILAFFLVACWACGSDDGGGADPDPPKAGEWSIEASVVLPGAISGIVAVPAGTSAFVSVGGGVSVVDIAGRDPLSAWLLPFASGAVGDLDVTGSLLSAQSSNRAGVLSAFTGEPLLEIEGSSLGRTTIANDTLYAPDFNNRGLRIASIDGSVDEILFPWGDLDRLATPRVSARSPSGAVVVFDDPNNGVLHAIESEENQITGTYLVGSNLRRLFVADEATAVAVATAASGFDSTTFAAPGWVAIVDLSNPMSVPDFPQSDALELLVDAAMDFDRATLVLLSAVVLEETVVEGAFPTIDRVYGLALSTMNLADGTATIPSLLPGLEFQDRIPQSSLVYSSRAQTLLLGLGNTLHFVERTAS